MRRGPAQLRLLQGAVSAYISPGEVGQGAIRASQRHICNVLPGRLLLPGLLHAPVLGKCYCAGDGDIAVLVAQRQIAQETFDVVQAAAAKDKSLVNCPQPGCEGLAVAGGELRSLTESAPQLPAPAETQIGL